MKMNKLKLTAVLSAAVLFLPVSLKAQTKLQSSVFGGGTTNVSNGRLRISGTLGQPLVGRSRHNAAEVGSGFWALRIDRATSVEVAPTEAIPKESRLEQNYPNPFNPTTTIEFALPKGSNVVLKLFDLLGREIVTLLDEEKNAGRYKVNFEANGLPSGVYFYRIEADGFVATKKLTLLK